MKFKYGLRCYWCGSEDFWGKVTIRAAFRRLVPTQYGERSVRMPALTVAACSAHARPSTDERPEKKLKRCYRCKRMRCYCFGRR